jgi:hypothetical protein
VNIVLVAILSAFELPSNLEGRLSPRVESSLEGRLLLEVLSSLERRLSLRVESNLEGKLLLRVASNLDGRVSLRVVSSLEGRMLLFIDGAGRAGMRASRRASSSSDSILEGHCLGFKDGLPLLVDILFRNIVLSMFSGVVVGG